MKTILKTKTLAVVLISLFTAGSLNAATYTVTNTNDAGIGSLRQAIIDANANAGPDIIVFNIPDLGLAGQYFEGAASARYAVIRLTDDLPVITGSVLIDGFTQSNTNTGVMAGMVVGVDNITQASINYPDIYIVPDISGGYVRSDSITTSSRGYGNGININATDVTLRGIAISGFGNTSTSATTAGLSGDICILRSSTLRLANILISDCFIACDPLGNAPAPASDRRSLGAAIVIGGNNYNGSILRNFIKNTGTYGIHFNGGVDHARVGPSFVNLPNANWIIEDNRLIDISWNNSFVGPGSIVTSTTGLVADAINTMHCSRLQINKNYISNVEQVGIDLGWNADSNYVSNNSITGFTKTYAGPVQCGIRAALSSIRDSIIKNRIFNNNGTAFKAGVWIDMSAPPPSTTGMSYYGNEFHLISQNHIYNNNSSGVVLSTYTPTTLVSNRYHKITQNLFYDNTGLGIDLNYTNVTGPTAVTVNDNNDTDAGTNNVLNFPIIDSVKRTPTSIRIWGKVAAGANLEFYFTDGGSNMHGGRLYSYGEAEYYIGSAQEGSLADLVTTTGLSYNIDGNVAINNMNGFSFLFPLSSLPPGLAPLVTATATISDNTSEFGPIVGPVTLSNELFSFSGKKINTSSQLKWELATNSNIRSFEVEHAADGLNFNRIGVVENNSTYSSSLQVYEFKHEEPVSGLNYYRIKTLYLNGKTEYSSIINLNFNAMVFDVKAGPNPFTNKIMVGFYENKSSALYKLRLTEMTGKTIATVTYKSSKGYNNFEWTGFQLPLHSGVYIIEIISETGERRSSKLIHE
ncbi:MAG: T9SS type A sorting domain-containing protein [Chitinophagaceae bacterium]|nr:T9SS type A sorting domain-containing protein [Chitinophagaceae bacterium]